MITEYANQNLPWLQRSDWAERKSVGQERRQAWVWWLFPIFLAPFALGLLLIASLATLSEKNSLGSLMGVWAVALFFLALEGLTILPPLYETRRLRKFGNPDLNLDAVPVPLGGVLRGEINLGPTVPAGTDFTLNLHCIQYWQQAMDGNVTDKVVFWQNEQTVKVLPGGRLPISFLVPSDGQETGNKFMWRLRVVSAGAGMSFRNQYQIPVYSVPLTDQDLQAVQATTTAYQVQLDEYLPPLNSRIHVSSLPDETTEFFFEAGRAPMFSAVLLLMAISALMFPAISMIFAQSGKEAISFWIPLIMFVVGIGFILASIASFFGTKRVRIRTEGMIIEDAIGFLSMGSTIIPAHDVITIKSDAKFTSTWGVVYNRLLVQCKDGTANAGNLIADAKESEWLASQMLKRLNR